MQAPRGTRDFGPDDMAYRRAVEARLRDVFAAYGYREVQTPTFELLELFTAKSGPGIVEELYAFRDKSDRDLALRPELTAPVMRLYFDSMKMAPKPVKLYYVANCFRYDRPQAGRYREFWQMGCELIGDAGAVGLAELLALGLGLVEAAGLREYRLRVGHLGLLRAGLAKADVGREDQRAVLRLIDKGDREALEKTLPRADGTQALFELLDAEDLDAVGAAVDGADAQGALDELAGVLGHLEALGAPIKNVRVDGAIARGLDYYTGLVFELDAPKLGAEKQLLGGGTYDLADVFDQPPVPTAGFALGFDRLLVALGAEGAARPEPAGPDVYAAALSESARGALLSAAGALRRAGARVEVEPQVRAPGKALSRAAQVGAAFAVIVGDREVEAGAVGFKDLGSGDQRTVPAGEVAEHWSKASASPGARPQATRRQG